MKSLNIRALVAVGGGLCLLTPVLAGALPVPVPGFAARPDVAGMLHESLQGDLPGRAGLLAAAEALLREQAPVVGAGSSTAGPGSDVEVVPHRSRDLYLTIVKPAEDRSRSDSGSWHEREYESESPGGSAVPLPPTAWLLVGGLGLIALSRRRKRT